ncbi:MAG TPA: YMGG-like glycine zipper-containing protein [Acetobacteraceae bacterium]
MPIRAHLVLATAAIGLAGCIYAPPPVPVAYNPYDPGDRAAAGALVGAGAGAALGGIAGGGRGAAIGALSGGALGAIVGSSATPPPPYPYAPYGYGD